MADMTKAEFMNRLSDGQRFEALWDWLERLDRSGRETRALLEGLHERLKKVEAKVGGSA